MLEDETLEQSLARRAELKMAYKEFYESVSEVLFRLDPIEINFKTNDDEYEPEVDTILPRLKSCKTVEDVLDVVFEEFQKWFGEDSAGKKDDYKQVANEIWILWLNWKNKKK